MKPSSSSVWFFGLAACFSLWLCCSVYASAVKGLSNELLGVSPLDEKYYSSQLIKCKDGSKSFVKARLNDGYCDCSDGTDEPGTSACPEGRFYCRNEGHSPVTLFSSRVNDGICDCCDGSDEYDGKVKCSNTCWEAGKAAREKLVKKIATYQEGSTLRKKEIDKAKQEFVKEEEELSNLKNEEKLLKDLVDKLRERKEQIEKVEEQERLEKEKEEAKKKEAEDKLNGEEKKTEEPTSSSPSELVEDKLDFPEEPEGGDGSDAKDEAENIHSDVSEVASDITSQKEHETSESTDGLSKEELGRLVASRWTGQSQNDDHHPKKDDHHPKDDAHNKKEDDHHSKEDDHVGNFENTDASDNPEDGSGNNHDDYPSHNHDNYPSHDHDNYPSDNDETNHEWEDKYEDEEDYEVENEDFDHNTPDTMHDDVNDAAEVSDLPPASRLSWLNKIQNAFRSVLAALKLSNTPVDKSEADRVRKEYSDYNGKLSKVQSRISSLTDKLKEDFGPQKEFYSFYGTCFEYKENKYVYKVCPYKQASQNEGHSSTQLGRWEKFEESYRVMRFSNGDKCWNGPDRSLKIRLRCGLKNELTDVDEPSRCEYVALLSTPAVCVEEKLKELEKKLDELNAGRHDEL